MATTLALAPGTTASAETAAALGRSAIASAPCSGRADISVKLAASTQPNELDRLVVKLSDALPHRTWALNVAVYQGDSGGVGSIDLRTDRRGEWTLQDETGSGRQRIVVDARSMGGQRCLVTLTARVSPLS